MTDLSVTQYNPYNMYQNFRYYPGFRGATVQQNNYNSVPQMTLQPDTVSFSANGQIQAETKKQGLSKGAKWGIGTVAVLGLGALAYVLTKGKAGSSSAKQILEEFKPAKTIDEARAFANKTLNVQYLHDNKANLDMINTVNEWLYREKAVAKKNIPDFINFVEKDIENPLGITDKIYHEGKAYNALDVNVNYINKFEELIEYALKPSGGGVDDLSRLIRKNCNGVYEVVKPEYRCENLDKLIQKLNAYNKSSTYRDKMEIYDGLSEAISYLGNITAGKNTKMAGFSAYGSFLHEIGHMLHQDTYKFWNEARTEGSKIYQEFQQANIQNVAGQVSDYAKSNPLEFVAETYKRLRRGQTFSNDVMVLYKKYGGPSIS